MKCPLCRYRPRPGPGSPSYVRNRKVELTICHVLDKHPEAGSALDGCFYCGACGGGHIWPSGLWQHWALRGGLVMHLMEERLR